MKLKGGAIQKFDSGLELCDHVTCCHPALNLKMGKMIYCVDKQAPDWARRSKTWSKSGQNFSRSGQKKFLGHSHIVPFLVSMVNIGYDCQFPVVFYMHTPSPAEYMLVIYALRALGRSSSLQRTNHKEKKKNISCCHKCPLLHKRNEVYHCNLERCSGQIPI